jgi:hypothetical protein
MRRFLWTGTVHSAFCVLTVTVDADIRKSQRRRIASESRTGDKCLDHRSRAQLFRITIEPGTLEVTIKFVIGKGDHSGGFSRGLPGILDFAYRSVLK